MFSLAGFLFALRLALVGLPTLVLVGTWSVIVFIAVCSKDRQRRVFVLKVGIRVESMIGRLVGAVPERKTTTSPQTAPEIDVARELAVVPELGAKGAAESKPSPRRAPRRSTPKNES